MGGRGGRGAAPGGVAHGKAHDATECGAPVRCLALDSTVVRTVQYDSHQIKLDC